MSVITLLLVVYLFCSKIDKQKKNEQRKSVLYKVKNNKLHACSISSVFSFCYSL